MCVCLSVALRVFVCFEKIKMDSELWQLPEEGNIEGGKEKERK